MVYRYAYAVDSKRVQQYLLWGTITFGSEENDIYFEVKTLLQGLTVIIGKKREYVQCLLIKFT